MLECLERHTEVRFKPFALPDYNSALPGAARGRAPLTHEFDGRRLGARLAELRIPLPQLMLFGSMQVEGADIHPLRNALRTWGGLRHTRKLIGRFVLDRLRHGRGMRLVNGNALAARLSHAAVQSGVTLWKDTPALEIVRHGDGVTGVAVLGMVAGAVAQQAVGGARPEGRGRAGPGAPACCRKRRADRELPPGALEG